MARVVFRIIENVCGVAGHQLPDEWGVCHCSILSRIPMSVLWLEVVRSHTYSAHAMFKTPTVILYVIGSRISMNARTTTAGIVPLKL